MKDKFSKNTYFVKGNLAVSLLQVKTGGKAIYRMDNPNKKYFDKPWYKTLGGNI